ncbi:MAG: hypothetical protein AB7O21_19635 [Gammaproteobacteria bacterium]
MAQRTAAPIPDHASYRLQHTCCRRQRCKVCRGTDYTHGPYWYAEWLDERKRQRGRGRPVIRTRYVGALLPLDVAKRIAEGIGEEAERARKQLRDPRVVRGPQLDMFKRRRKSAG